MTEQQEPLKIHEELHGKCGNTETRTGEPCAKNAGWGTDHPGEGYCKYHEERTVEALKQQYVEIYRDLMTYHDTSVALKLGPDRVYTWRRSDPEFRAALDALEPTMEERRLRVVEDSLFRKCRDGTAGAAEMVFFLVNRGGGRWRDVRHVEAHVKTDLLEVLREAWQEHQLAGGTEATAIPPLSPTILLDSGNDEGIGGD